MLLEIVDLDDPPQRLPLGSDALGIAEKHNHALAEELETWARPVPRRPTSDKNSSARAVAQYLLPCDAVGMAEQERDVRQVTDSRVLAAMAHPLRRRLLDVLAVYGPQPVGALAERTGQAPANISHHMKVMRDMRPGRRGPGAGPRPPRAVVAPGSAPACAGPTKDFDDDAGEAAVLRAAESLNLDRQVALVREWYAAPDEEQAVWGESAFAADRWLHLTPAELAELSRDIVAVLDRWSAKAGPATADDQPRRPVFVFAHGVPATP